MTFVAAASTVCRSNVQRPVLGHRRRARCPCVSRNTSPCATWSLTSPRADRISGPQKSCSSARKDFFNSIWQQRTHICSNRRRGRQGRRPKHSHKSVVAGFQKRKRSPTVGSMLLCWRKPKPNPPCTWLNIMPK